MRNGFGINTDNLRGPLGTLEECSRKLKSDAQKVDEIKLEMGDVAEEIVPVLDGLAQRINKHAIAVETYGVTLGAIIEEYETCEQGIIDNIGTGAFYNTNSPKVVNCTAYPDAIFIEEFSNSLSQAGVNPENIAKIISILLGMTAADGPLLAGDAIAAIAAVLIASGVVGYALYLLICQVIDWAENNISFSKKKGKSGTKDKGKSGASPKEEPHTRNKDGEPLGKNGPRIHSKTVGARGKGGVERIDVENHDPGERGGNIHYHDPKNNKYVFDVTTGLFYVYKTGELAPPAIQRMLDDPTIRKWINDALRALGEDPFF